ncbi:MAG: hypothetical protein JRJ42_04620 [Deltaproteobacteria bacterium]|nr:hypothetical protein [Deltaproteobacteria bacterium]MBW2019042.1 hypothetical protein [Deltaproteobacteria bacterium]MBW2073802.1 hypothetical protein [Deltaproteobacteria bacterium]RLB82947.1 MAG: hypothetical protein DRH17_04110 [Deltaproteobacteria bacterium]
MKRHIPVITLLILSLFLSTHVHGEEKPIKIKTIAVMPFENFTIGDDSFDFTRLITDRLIDKFSVIPQDILEGFLVKKRVRRTGLLNRVTIREMGMALNIDALMTGSVDSLSGGENPRVALSAQMMHCVDSSIIWANAVSYTGEDFATILGIGKIYSLKRLVDVAVTDLLKGLPAKVGAHELVKPFEIVHASFFPKVLKGGQTTTVSIEVSEITGKLKDLKAFVLDTQIGLSTKDGLWYTGILTAPSIEGVYPLRIYMTDQSNRLFSMDGVAQLIVDNTPPEVTLSSGQKVISPNKDGIKDSILFFPELLNADTLESWRVEIRDESGTVVRSEDGIGALPGGFIWRGEDNTYKSVRDGTYFCQLILEDTAGNRTVSPRKTIVVDATAPEVELVLAGEDDQGITLELKTKDISEIADWELTIYDRKGIQVGKLEGKGDIPTRLSCTLKSPNSEKKGFLAYSLAVTDIAGNRLEREKEPLEPSKPEGPEQKPPEKKIWIEDF